MAKCKKCDPHEICEECPEWIFTLADLIMCMMGLFVILWVLKKEGEPVMPASAREAVEKREKEVLDEISRGFMGYRDDPTSSRNEDSPSLNGPGQRGNASQSTESPEGRDRQSTTVRYSRTAAAGDYLNFAAGSDELTAKARAQIEKLAETSRGKKQIILVKGHASLDDLPRGSTSEQFMDLSMRRAKRVQDYLVRLGLEPDILRVVGCGRSEPIVERRPAPEHAQNRRVEVEVTSTLITELQDPQGVAKPLPKK